MSQLTWAYAEERVERPLRALVRANSVRGVLCRKDVPDTRRRPIVEDWYSRRGCREAWAKAMPERQLLDGGVASGNIVGAGAQV